MVSLSLKGDAAESVVKRQMSQIIRRPIRLARRMEGIWAITFRPGGHQESFLGSSLFRPLGAAAIMVQRSEVITAHGRTVQRIDFLGYKAQIDLVSGEAVFGGPDGNIFCHDVGKKMGDRRDRRVLNPATHAGLAEVALDLDARREAAARRSYKLPVVPQLPRVWLAFDATPAYEESPALVRRVARQLGRPPAAVLEMDTQDRELLLKDAFLGVQLPAEHPENPTGMHLIPAHFATRQIGWSAKILEDFRGLVGQEIYNPARLLAGRSERIANPIREVASRLGCLELLEKIWANDPEKYPEAQAELTEAAVDSLDKALREQLGEATSCRISQEGMYAALGCPDELIELGPLGSPLEMGEEACLAAMRQLLGPTRSSYCADADLLAAAADPSQPLFARGMPGVQLLQQDLEAPPEEAFRFDSQRLGMPGTSVDFWSTRNWSGSGSYARA